jgi:hypothetical protein
MFIRIFIVASTISSLASYAAEAPPYSYKLLKDSRPEITLPNSSLDDKKIVLDQAYLVLNEIFVHRDLKLTNFGTEIDPLPMIKNLEGKVDSISDRDFHKELAIIFTRQNDLHTTYAFPKPYACYRSFLPFSFKEVIGLDGQKVIAVNKIIDTAEVVKLFPDLNVKIGDILVSYNGKPAYEAAQAWAARSSGANPPATRRRSINLLGFVSQKYDFLPGADEVNLILRNRHGVSYSVAVPWVARSDNKCLAVPEAVETGAMGEDNYQNDFNRVYRSTKKPVRNKLLNMSPLQDSADPILKYSIVKNEFGDFGYIRLESFVPEKLTDKELVLEVKKILLTNLAKTDGLIFDLRNNGGGYISIAEALVQLFSPKNTVPLNFRLKNSPANRHFMYQTRSDDPFSIELKAAEEIGAAYTKPIPLNPADELDLVGQYYFKPVALLTNANCYSSCDMFSASMQDHEAAIIFGEDSTTGAGGANNRSLNDTVKALDESLGPYKVMPLGQDIGFSFRQTIRTGKSEGIFLEDRGVLSDAIAPTTLSDLYTDSGDQFKIIGKVLNEKAKDYLSWVKINESRLDILNTDEPKFFIQWEQTDKIEFKSNRTTLSQVEVELDNSTGREFPFLNLQGTNGEFELIGTKNGKRVWRKIQQYRMIPAGLTMEENLVINLETGAANPLAIYNFQNKADDGWIIQDGMLKTGKSAEYADSTKTEASLFLILSEAKDFTLNFDSEVSTEKDFDYFKVKLVADGKEIELIKGISGEEALKTYNFDLSLYKGKKVEIRFIFESDKGVTGKGVIIKNLSLTQLGQ